MFSHDSKKDLIESVFYSLNPFVKIKRRFIDGQLNDEPEYNDKIYKF